MNSTKVFIENLPPPQEWYVTWIPIIIALCAIIVSLYSLYLSRRQYRDSSRPFLFSLTNYLAIQNNGAPFHRPEILPYKIINAPAIIKKMKIEFYIQSGPQKTVLHLAEITDLSIFPADMTESSYNYAELSEDLSLCTGDSTLKRHVRFDYTALSGGKKYFFEAESEYNFADNTWKRGIEKAS
jgi:hypothetical protein